jgi:hypothetical protein
LYRLFAPAAPPQRLSARVATLENTVDELDSRVEYLGSELKKVRGRQFSFERQLATPQEAPEETNGSEETQEAAPQGPRRSFAPTAHLARRFRGF